MERKNVKQVLGKRLRELRTQAHQGKGYSQEKAAKTIGRTEAYLNRLETRCQDENPTIDMLIQLCDLYGVELGELFRPLVRDTSQVNAELKEKLDFIIACDVEITHDGIIANIHAMYDYARKLKKQS